MRPLQTLMKHARLTININIDENSAFQDVPLEEVQRILREKGITLSNTKGFTFDTDETLIDVNGNSVGYLQYGAPTRLTKELAAIVQEVVTKSKFHQKLEEYEREAWLLCRERDIPGEFAVLLSLLFMYRSQAKEWFAAVNKDQWESPLARDARELANAKVVKIPDSVFQTKYDAFVKYYGENGIEVYQDTLVAYQKRMEEQGR